MDGVMRELRQAWWAPAAALLALAQAWVGAAFIYGDGTSNLLDAEGQVVGGVLAFAGAGALGAGLWLRLRSHATGVGLVIVGALLGAIWFWTVLMTPLAITVLVGLLLTELRTREPASRPERP